MTVGVRMHDELKKKMKRYKYLNCNEVIRAEILRIIDRLESRNVAEALLINEKIRKKSNRDTTEILRDWREHRYGKGSG